MQCIHTHDTRTTHDGHSHHRQTEPTGAAARTTLLRHRPSRSTQQSARHTLEQTWPQYTYPSRRTTCSPKLAAGGLHTQPKRHQHHTPTNENTNKKDEPLASIQLSLNLDLRLRRRPSLDSDLTSTWPRPEQPALDLAFLILHLTSTATPPWTYAT